MRWYLSTWQSSLNMSTTYNTRQRNNTFTYSYICVRYHYIYFYIYLYIFFYIVLYFFCYTRRLYDFVCQWNWKIKKELIKFFFFLRCMVYIGVLVLVGMTYLQSDLIWNFRRLQSIRTAFPDETIDGTLVRKLFMILSKEYLPT